ncbi:MATE family efflux transporter [Martelella alba]|uniref:Multidrug-efflux transporter n=1 Tax=Martelella alba TaxID=2590451 RepID=A0A506UFU2_9HYPH|nr:MATE family efflux transporter [Martelella alba]TPW31769.1 MATE family efflux transporter [Martelella alba]
MSVTMPPAQAAGHSWSRHFRETLSLGIPLIGAQLAQQGINTTDIVILGQLSAVDLAAAVIATQYFFTLFIFGCGLAIAVMPMVAQAYGRGDEVAVRRSLRMGMWASLAFGLMVLPLFWYSEPILLAIGQEPDVAARAAIYCRIVAFAMFPALLFNVLRSLVSATGRAGIVLWATILMLLLNAALAYIVVLGHFGLPRFGIAGAAVVAFTVQLAGFLFLAIYIERDAEMRRYQLFVRFWRPDWGALREVVALGLPIGVAVLAEVSMFTVASLMMGRFGAIPLAAHGIAMQLAAITFMVPLGLSQAGTVRVGVFHGQGDFANLKRAAIAVVVLGLCFAMIGTMAFAFLPAQLASLFIDTKLPEAAAVIAYAVPLIIISGMTQLVDGTQTMMSGLLRGLKDTRIPMVLVLISYWGIGLGFAFVLAFPFDLKGIGIWIGFMFGLASAAAMLAARLLVLLRRERNALLA